MASSSDSEDSSTESVSLEHVVEEMTEVIATLRDTTGDVSAADDNADILETKVHEPLHNVTKPERLCLGDHLANIGAAEVLTSNIQWLRKLDHGGFSEDVWPYMSVLYNCCHNYTDVSQKFGEGLGKAGIVPILVQDLKELKETCTDGRECQIVISAMGILYNMSRFSGNRAFFSEANAIESLIPYLQVANVRFKTDATLALTYVIDEEHMRFVTDPSVFAFIINAFTKAVDDDMKRYTVDGTGFYYSADELAMGIERLAINDMSDDKNKLTLVAEGVLPPLFKLMTEGDEEEQLHAIRAISQLAFHPDNREKIRQFQVIPQLKKCERSKNRASVIAARGALWELGGAEARKQKVKTDAGKADDSAKGSRAGHVMLSYQWDNQDVVKKIKNTLDAKGYKVWMDIDRMGGSTLEAMAGAVEGASVVLVCMSRRYKESANCRKECEYAVTRGTDIIPLKMENTYQPDGWLGITIGSSLYFNFDDKDSFDDVMTRLMKEMGDRGKGLTAAVVLMDTVDSKLEGLKLHDWTQEDVKRWIKENKLEGDLEKLEPEDLQFLLRMRKEAPTEFYKSIDGDLGLKSISSKRKFSQALDKLE